jgi:DNA-binding LacI/PurR family transcriptional regulator
MANGCTICDVAQEAGVTKTSVSLALRNKPGVSNATRQRILQIARKMNYLPSPNRVTRGRVHYGQIAFVAISEDPPLLDESPGGSYLHRMIEGALHRAEEAGFSLGMGKLTWQQVHDRNWPSLLQKGHFDGMILRGWIMPEVDDFLKHLDRPIVLLDCDRVVPGCPQVQIDNIAGMDMLVGNLFQRGARTFATITGDMEHVNAQERLAGLQMALTRRGLELPAERIVLEHGFNAESGRRGLAKLLERNVRFDALVCQSDLIALGAMDVLEQKNPEPLLAGFDNMSFLEHLDMPLVTIDPATERMGARAVELVQDCIAGRNIQDNNIKVHPVLKCHETSLIQQAGT